MRNVTIGTPNLFDAIAAEPQMPVERVERVELDDEKPGTLAREFVRWCFSFGADFRNSPDAANLRYWLQRTKGNSPDIEENAVLLEARRLFMKKLEQSAGKADVSHEEHPVTD